tara:strand:- start:1084 stop:1350 length:267 start_codon:yes stop_codon:yes gene_type:complete
MPDRIRRVRRRERFGWRLDPSDDQYFIKHEEEQALLDKVAVFRKKGAASWGDVALMLTSGSDRKIMKSSAIQIVRRERPEVEDANREV